MKKDYEERYRAPPSMLNIQHQDVIPAQKAGQAPRRTQLTERVIGFRDLAIENFLDAKTA